MADSSYLYCGQKLESDIPFPELLQWDSTTPINTIVIAHTDYVSEDQIDWFHQWKDSPTILGVTLGRKADRYYIHVEDIGTFRFSPSENLLESKRENTDDELYRHILLHQVLPIVLSLNKELTILHGSAIYTEKGAIGFLGHAGAGKSTLAMRLTSETSPFITDDVLVLTAQGEHYGVIPSYPSSRLWSDSSEIIGLNKHPEENSDTKLRYRPAHYVDSIRGSLTLSMLLLLDKESSGGPASLERISAGEAITKVGSYKFELDFQGKKQMADEFQSLSDLVERVPIYQLRNYQKIRSHTEIWSLRETTRLS